MAMTPDERQKLRELALIALKATCARTDRPAGLPAEWELQTSNSFRRIGAHGDGDVLCATVHWRDHHPDLLAPSGVLDYIVAAQPRVVLDLLALIDALEGELEMIADIELARIKALAEMKP